MYLSFHTRLQSCKCNGDIYTHTDAEVSTTTHETGEFGSDLMNYVEFNYA